MMSFINHEHELQGSHKPVDIKGFLKKPLGSLAFRAKLLKLGYEASRDARLQLWGPTSSERRREHRSELYAQRREALVEDTLNRGEGSQRFLSKLAVEAGELHDYGVSVDYVVPDVPDFSEQAGVRDS